MSIVRNNLLTQLYYTPYCGAERCSLRWPRTTFRGDQFGCACGWRSGFEPEFIEQYKAAQAALAAGVEASQDDQCPNCDPTRFCTRKECNADGVGEVPRG